MELDKKKVIALIALILITIGLGYLIYVFFFKPAPNAQPTEQQPGQTTSLKPSEAGQPNAEQNQAAPTGSTVLPTAAAVQPGSQGPQIVAVTPLVTTPNNGVTLGANGNDLQYYNQADGKFYRTDAAGNKIALSDVSFPAVQSVTWAPNKTDAALSFPDGSKIIYDFNKQKQYTIPAHWSDINFSPDSTKIVGKSDSLDPHNRYLFTASVDGTGATPIEPLGDNADKVIVNWAPNNQVIAFARTAPQPGGAPDRQEIYMIGKNHENFKSLMVEGLDFQPQWSPTGDRVIYSAYNGATGYTPQLWVDGGNDQTVGAAKNFLNVQTWANKCTFASNDELICAVPNPDNMPAGIGFAPWSATDTDDTIYRINVKTGFQTVVGKPDGNRTIQQITVDKNNSVLYLKDQTTGEVLTMKLK